jgi:hypothetical protein
VTPRRPALAVGRVAAYFLTIGLAFLCVEIATIQRFILFLSHPDPHSVQVATRKLDRRALGGIAAWRMPGLRVHLQ